MIAVSDMSIEDKLVILSDAAKYDVACTSSGANRSNSGDGGIGNAIKGGICHAFSADGRCISLLKILFTNECIFDCKYCINRSSNDVVRASFTPDEVAKLTIEFYRRNYIEGLFLSSGIIISPNHTSELLYETLRLLRVEYHFDGYIHIKTIPGTSDELIDRIGWFADRMSVNLELPTADGLKALAPHKNRKNILTPMRHIQNGIGRRKDMELIPDNSNPSSFSLPTKNSINIIMPDSSDSSSSGTSDIILPNSKKHISAKGTDDLIDVSLPAVSDVNKVWRPKKTSRIYVPAGQSTQMIIGATKESDYQIMNVTESLYNNFNLKRVFYSAFINVNHDSALSDEPSPPLLREHRLYQADWLLRFYGFNAKELLSETKPNFNVFLDPKCDWAIRHLDIFPVEINSAPYYTLLRVPGIGMKSAKRIVNARHSSSLDFADLKKLGVVLKRALYFITCSGKMMYRTKIEEDYIVRNLINADMKVINSIEADITYKQLSLFDDFNITQADNFRAISG